MSVGKTNAVLKKLRYGFAAVQIAINTSDPSTRCTYPEYVTVNGKQVKNSAYGLDPAYNANKANAAGNTSTAAFDMGGWADHPILNGIKPVLKNGTTWTDLDKTGMTTWDNSADAFTEFPINWLAIKNDGTNITVIFSDKDTRPDADFQLYAFAKGCDSYSNEQIVTANASASLSAIKASDSSDYFANCFHIGCFVANGGSSAIYSKRGATVSSSVVYTNYWHGANARGTDYDCMSFQQWTYIQALFLLLYRSTNSQTAHSHGLAKVSSSSVSANTANAGVATTSFGMAGAINKAQVNSFFWIYNCWGNHTQFIGGLWNRKGSSSKAYYWLPRQANSRAFNNGWSAASTNATQASLGTDTGITGSKSGGFIKTVAGSNVAGFCPTSQSGGSSSTYWPDCGYVYYYSSRAYFPYVGGSYNYNAGFAGIFYCGVDNGSTDSGTNIVARLSYRGGHWESGGEDESMYDIVLNFTSNSSNVTNRLTDFTISNGTQTVYTATDQASPVTVSLPAGSYTITVLDDLTHTTSTFSLPSDANTTHTHKCYDFGNSVLE